jgi:hypothetical protein
MWSNTTRQGSYELLNGVMIDLVGERIKKLADRYADLGPGANDLAIFLMDGKWTVMLGNDSPVMLGEFDGEIGVYDQRKLSEALQEVWEELKRWEANDNKHIAR